MAEEVHGGRMILRDLGEELETATLVLYIQLKDLHCYVSPSWFTQIKDKRYPSPPSRRPFSPHSLSIV